MKKGVRSQKSEVRMYAVLDGGCWMAEWVFILTPDS